MENEFIENYEQPYPRRQAQPRYEESYASPAQRVQQPVRTPAGNGGNSVMKALSLGVIAILWLLSLALGYFLLDKAIKNTAIDGCIKTAVIEKTDGKQVIKTPENYWYNFCLEEKGIK